MPAAAPLEFLPPLLDGRVLAVSRWLLPLWLRQGSAITRVSVRHPERLLEAMVRFQAGESRLLIAFRHPSVDDPLCMAHLLWQNLPREAKRRGARLRPAPHAQFLYDRGIPLWAGQPAGWSRPAGTASIRPAATTLGALCWSGAWQTGWRRKRSDACGTCGWRKPSSP